jgi:hypothetical protein
MYIKEILDIVCFKIYRHLLQFRIIFFKGTVLGDESG